MRLKNKKTGEIGLVHCDATMFSNKIGVFIDNNHIDLRNPYKVYNSLAELNAEWEDYEEPDEIWYIDWKGDIRSADIDNDWVGEKQIGNYFSSREEAEEAVEKLKAWKRLKDKGFRFDGYKLYIFNDQGANPKRKPTIDFILPESVKMSEAAKDLDLLFSQEDYQ